MEKPAFSERVVAGARELGLPLSEAGLEALGWLAGELVRWSARINLTAIVDPIEIADKHILDSLAVLRILDPGPRSLLDAGTGAGFPGLPLAIARDDLEVTLVDSVAKKVGFLKHAIAGLGLAPRVQARQLTLEGDATGEGLGPFDAAVSRALADPQRWAALARPYLRQGGQLVVMAGGSAPPTELAGWTGPTVDRFRLPSGDARTLLSYRKVEE